MAIRLSVGYKTWPPTASLARRLADLNIDWKIHSILGNLQYITCPRDRCEFSPFCKGLKQSPYTTLKAGSLPAFRAVQGDCERVSVNTATGQSQLSRHNLKQKQHNHNIIHQHKGTYTFWCMWFIPTDCGFYCITLSEKTSPSITKELTVFRLHDIARFVTATLFISHLASQV